MKEDSSHYSLLESDMERIGLEFSRTKYQDLSLEAYKINTLLFPNSWKAYDSYTFALSKKTENKNASIIIYKKSMELDRMKDNK